MKNTASILLLAMLANFSLAKHHEKSDFKSIFNGKTSMVGPKKTAQPPTGLKRVQLLEKQKRVALIHFFAPINSTVTLNFNSKLN